MHATKQKICTDNNLLFQTTEKNVSFVNNIMITTHLTKRLTIIKHDIIINVILFRHCK